MKWALLAILASVAGAAIFMLIAVGLLAINAQRKLDGAQPQIKAIALDFRGTLDQANRALADIHAIEIDTQRTEAEMAGLLNQTRHSMMTPAETKELVERAANLLDNANLATIRLGAAAQSLEGIAPTTQGAIAQIAQDAHTTETASQAMIQAATSDLSDPAIHETLEQGKEASANLNGMSRDGKAMTTDAAEAVHRWTRPVTGTWHILKAFLFEIAGPAASVASAAK